MESYTQADYHTVFGNSDHEAAVMALLAGQSRDKYRQQFLIHVSGTGTIADTYSHPGGTLNPKIWSDIDSLPELQSLPLQAMHRPVDKLLQEWAAEHGEANQVNIAITCPPDIFEPGTGTGKKVSWAVPYFVDASLKAGYVFYADKGENVRSFIGMSDLADLYIRLIEDAASGSPKADWGKDVSTPVLRRVKHS
jgi:nucleoside-diphosphate-sugar epimerase